MQGCRSLIKSRIHSCQKGGGVLFARIRSVSMKRSPIVATELLFLALVLASAVAQQAPGSQADANNPSGPPGPIQTTSIWKVDPLTGALTLNIPLTRPLPGSRGPHFGRTL